MNYRKERNFIVAYEGETCRGKWDILTNQFYGIRGGLVKSRPSAFSHESLYNVIVREGLDSTAIISFMYLMYDYANELERQFTAEMGRRIEEIISVDLRFRHASDTISFLTTDKTTLNKECVTYLKDHYNGVYSKTAIIHFNEMKQFADCYAHATDDQDKEWISEVIDQRDNKLPNDFVSSMIRRATTEKVRLCYDSYDFTILLSEWVEYLTALGEEIKVCHNILTTYAIIKWRYEKLQEQNYNTILKRNNDKPFLYFEDESYIAIPLLSREDFHREATAQNNCVESTYMDYAKRGVTYIVGVRLKSDPNRPYITCEVNRSGHIEQYLRKYNGDPEYKDKVFKEKFQKYIYQKMDEVCSCSHAEGG